MKKGRQKHDIHMDQTMACRCTCGSDALRYLSAAARIRIQFHRYLRSLGGVVHQQSSQFGTVLRHNANHIFSGCQYDPRDVCHGTRQIQQRRYPAVYHVTIPRCSRRCLVRTCSRLGIQRRHYLRHFQKPIFAGQRDYPRANGDSNHSIRKLPAFCPPACSQRQNLFG